MKEEELLRLRDSAHKYYKEDKDGNFYLTIKDLDMMLREYVHEEKKPWWKKLLR